MKKILLSIAVIGVAGVLAVNATTAIFSDVEKSTGNTFTAGEIDLLVDNTQHYAGMVCADITDDNPDKGYIWVEEEDGSSARPELIGEECNGTWTETDLGPSHKFFDFTDVKPGDEGENTISLHIEGNDAYVCAIIDNLENNDNGCNEPEGKVDATCGDPGVGEGELADELYFFAWEDDGDNIWEDGETPLLEGPASNILGGVAYPIYTPVSTGGIGPMTGGDTVYIGLYWCLGDLSVDGGNYELACDGASATNITQSDSLSADITFYVEQARNNPNFVCVIPDPEPTTGTLTIVKNVTGSADPEDFTFDVIDSDGNLDLDTVIYGSYTLEEGTYEVDEDEHPGYTEDFSGCFDGEVTIVAGVETVCTVVNTEDPTTGIFTVTKTVDGGDLDVIDFPLFVSGEPVDSGVGEEFSEGDYTVTETDNSGLYVATFGGECDANGDVTITVGGDHSCAVTNTYTPAELTVDKVLVITTGGVAASDFILHINGPGVDMDVTDNIAVADLPAGEYTVTETATGPAASLTFTTVYSGDCTDNSGSSGTVTLTNGSGFLCTVTNTEVY